MTSQFPSPGWYPDTTVSGEQRYWDGRAWTEHTAPAGPNGPTPSPPAQGSQGPEARLAVATPTPKSTSNRGWIIGGSIAAAVVVVLVIIAVSNSTRGSVGSVGSVGQPVRDGNLEFTVTNTKVGTDFFANGTPGSGNVYFVASVTLKATGTLSESVSPVDQVAVAGTIQYKASAFAVSSDSSGSGNGGLDFATLVLAPGATMYLQIPWVVPVGTKVSYLILHTSGSSSGARINID